MLCMWNCGACNLSALACFMQHNCFKTHPSFVINSCCFRLVTAFQSMEAPLFNHYPLKGMASRSWLSRIKLLWTFVYTFLCEHKHSFLWDKSPRVNLLGHVVVAYMVSQETAKCISRAEILKQIQVNLIKINWVHLLSTPVSSRIASVLLWSLVSPHREAFMPSCRHSAQVTHRTNAY